jgi:anti-anti-sigma factor
MDLMIRTDVVGSVPVLAASGDIDLSTVPQFRDAVVELLADHPGEVVAIDLDEVAAIDDTGLGVLLGMAARARQRAGELVVVCSPNRLHERLIETRLARAVRVVEAIHLVVAPSPPTL